MIKYLGTSTFVGSGSRLKKLSRGYVVRFEVTRDWPPPELWEVYVWEAPEAIAHDEDEAPVCLRINGEPVEEFGSLEEFFQKHPEFKGHF